MKLEEQRTGGGKEFVFSVIWAAALLFIGRIITLALPDYKIAGVLLTIVMYCVLGFFVLTRYAAIYTFTLKNNRLRIVRSIGHRTKEADVPLSRVKSVTKTRPACKARLTSMRTTVFTRKSTYYILYEENGTDLLLACDISRELFIALKKERKKEI